MDKLGHCGDNTSIIETIDFTKDYFPKATSSMLKRTEDLQDEIDKLSDEINEIEFGWHEDNNKI